MSDADIVDMYNDILDPQWGFCGNGIRRSSKSRRART